MTRCIICGKRANARHSCFWCGRGPECLNCKCVCELWPGGKHGPPLKVPAVSTKKEKP